MKTPIALSFAALIASACATPSQMAVDEEVKRLCAVDGGIKVHETVRLSPNKFDSFGVVTVPLKRNRETTDEFYYIWDNAELKAFNAGVGLSRSHYKLFRANGDQLLGEAIAYSRIGGDFPSPWHPSSYGCPDGTDISSLKRQVFKNIEGVK